MPPVSQLSSPPLSAEGRTGRPLGPRREKSVLGGFWTCQTVLLGVVGREEEVG